MCSLQKAHIVKYVPRLFVHDCTFFTVFRHSSKAARGRPYAPVPGGPPQCKAFTDLPHCVFPMLIHLGPHLSSDPILMAKILRISKGFMKDVRQFLV